MRKQGRIVRWDDARGFGFMRSADTPADVFFHVRDWAGGAQRPMQGLEVVYEEIHVGGKGPRGMAVRPAAQRASSAQASVSRSLRARWTPDRGSSPRLTTARPASAGRGNIDAHPGPMLVLIAAYAAVLMVCVMEHRIPLAPALGVPFVSLATFFAYWHDKHAARRGAWRTSEQTLHVFALLGGWPGAWLAHRVLRHKSRKTSFRAVYRATVALHCAAVVGWAVTR
jgi:uncharacterized membrane protein YsdA (DUF1294 family)/cold shock CspA family protein